MSNVITCPSCQRKYAFKPELAGKRAKCKCGEKIQFPDSVEAEGLLPEPELDIGKPVAPPVRTAPSCPGCGAEMAPGAVICTSCGYNMRTGQRMGTQVLQESAAPRTQPRRPAGRTLDYQSASASSAEPLSGFDIVLIIFCSFIALIIGIVRGAQGRGWNMAIGAGIAMAFWTVVRVAMMVATGGLQ